jgi:hypothetical protein
MDGQPGFRRVDRLISRLAGRQHGVVARWQLLAAGVTETLIDHRVACGRLHVLHRGVYAVGHKALTQEGAWTAALFAAGKGAVLSRRSAAELWRIVPARSAVSHVTLAVARHPARLPGVHRHSSNLPPDEVTRAHWIPVTTVPRTMLDLASVLTRPELARAFREAEANHKLTPTSLSLLLDRHRGRRGGAQAPRRPRRRRLRHRDHPQRPRGGLQRLPSPPWLAAAHPQPEAPDRPARDRGRLRLAR